MGLVEFVSRPTNYLLTGLVQVVKKIVTDPSADKKVSQIVCKIFAGIDLYQAGKIRDSAQDPALIKVLKGNIALIEFYSTFKNIVYWINPFSKDSLDKDSLKQSIEDSLTVSHLDPKDIQQQKDIAAIVFKEVMAAREEYHSKGEVLDAIRVSLNNHKYDPIQASKLAERIVVEQKARPLVQNLYMVCFTIADLGSNIFTLKTWGILDLSNLAATIGSQSRVFMFVMEVGVEKVLGFVAGAGLVLVIGEASYRAILHGIELYNAANDEDKEKAYKELRNALLDFVSTGADLVALSTPLLFALSPPVVVGLAIFAKGTGLICILVR